MNFAPSPAILGGVRAARLRGSPRLDGHFQDVTERFAIGPTLRAGGPSPRPIHPASMHDTAAMLPDLRE